MPHPLQQFPLPKPILYLELRLSPMPRMQFLPVPLLREAADVVSHLPEEHHQEQREDVVQLLEPELVVVPSLRRSTKQSLLQPRLLPDP
jgi:hypothetical protein